jgi:uncharacterized protein YdaU (DUF1376 family)
MKSSPAFQFYPADFLVGTALMSAEEVGGYIRLLCYQWTEGALPDNDKKLMQLSLVFDLESLKVIRSKFSSLNNGTIVNLKLELVRKDQDEFRQKQRVKAQKRWDSQSDAAASPRHMPEECPSPSPISSTIPTSIPLPSKKDLMLSRKKTFASTLEPFVSLYGKEMIREFYNYWTEHNKSETKFKQESEKTWSIELRLERWAKNDFNKSAPTTNKPQIFSKKGLNL